MTQFLPSYIPAEITTIEQLYVWCSEILVYRYPDKLIVQTLDPNGEEIRSQQIEGNKYYYTAPAIPEWRYSTTGGIKLSPDHHLGGGVWLYALPIGSETVPTQMRKAA